MVVCMKSVASGGVELTVEERNLLSVAYKNVIGARRASWRIISSIEQKENKGSNAKVEVIHQYKSTVIVSFLLLNFFLVLFCSVAEFEMLYLKLY